MGQVRRVIDWLGDRARPGLRLGRGSRRRLLRYDAHGVPITDDAMAKAMSCRCGPAGCRRRAQVGRVWPFEAEARARALALAQGYGAFRQPAPGALLRCLWFRGLDLEAGGGRRPRHHDRARTDRRHLFRRAARHRGSRRRRAARREHPGLHHLERDPPCGSRRPSNWRASARAACAPRRSANVMESGESCGARR